MPPRSNKGRVPSSSDYQRDIDKTGGRANQTDSSYLKNEAHAKRKQRNPNVINDLEEEEITVYEQHYKDLSTKPKERIRNLRASVNSVERRVQQNSLKNNKYNEGERRHVHYVDVIADRLEENVLEENDNENGRIGRRQKNKFLMEKRKAAVPPTPFTFTNTSDNKNASLEYFSSPGNSSSCPISQQGVDRSRSGRNSISRLRKKLMTVDTFTNSRSAHRLPDFRTRPSHAVRAPQSPDISRVMIEIERKTPKRTKRAKIERVFTEDKYGEGYEEEGCGALRSIKMYKSPMMADKEIDVIPHMEYHNRAPQNVMLPMDMNSSHQNEMNASKPIYKSPLRYIQQHTNSPFTYQQSMQPPIIGKNNNVMYGTQTVSYRDDHNRNEWNAVIAQQNFVNTTSHTYTTACSPSKSLHHSVQTAPYFPNNSILSTNQYISKPTSHHPNFQQLYTSTSNNNSAHVRSSSHPPPVSDTAFSKQAVPQFIYPLPYPQFQTKHGSTSPLHQTVSTNKELLPHRPRQPEPMQVHSDAILQPQTHITSIPPNVYRPPFTTNETINIPSNAYHSSHRTPQTNKNIFIAEDSHEDGSLSNTIHENRMNGNVLYPIQNQQVTTKPKSSMKPLNSYSRNRSNSVPLHIEFEAIKKDMNFEGGGDTLLSKRKEMNLLKPIEETKKRISVLSIETSKDCGEFLYDQFNNENIRTNGISKEKGEELNDTNKDGGIQRKIFNDTKQRELKGDVFLNKGFTTVYVCRELLSKYKFPSPPKNFQPSIHHINNQLPPITRNASILLQLCFSYKNFIIESLIASPEKGKFNEKRKGMLLKLLLIFFYRLTIIFSQKIANKQKMKKQMNTSNDTKKLKESSSCNPLQMELHKVLSEKFKDHVMRTTKLIKEWETAEMIVSTLELNVNTITSDIEENVTEREEVQESVDVERRKTKEVLRPPLDLQRIIEETNITKEFAETFEKQRQEFGMQQRKKMRRLQRFVLNGIKNGIIMLDGLEEERSRIAEFSKLLANRAICNVDEKKHLLLMQNTASRRSEEWKGLSSLNDLGTPSWWKEKFGSRFPTYLRDLQSSSFKTEMNGDVLEKRSSLNSLLGMYSVPRAVVGMNEDPIEGDETSGSEPNVKMTLHHGVSRPSIGSSGLNYINTEGRRDFGINLPGGRQLNSGMVAASVSSYTARQSSNFQWRGDSALWSNKATEENENNSNETLSDMGFDDFIVPQPTLRRPS